MSILEVRVMFEITKAHIKKLSDADLRELTGLLCEATLARHGLPVSAVTYGGHQDTRDGGIDVRVQVNVRFAEMAFIPRAFSGYQAKSSVMTPSKIMNEMRPNGILRPSIAELARFCGAYVIVSSGDDLTDPYLRERRQTMRNALVDEPFSAQLETDFIDKTRLSTWIRQHAGLVLWVREKVGAGLTGWHPWGAWACPSESVEATYIVDEHIRARLPDGRQEVSALHTLDWARMNLQVTGASIRLVGLSGVGKTRFAQALFDVRLGSNALATSLAVYTDASSPQLPAPQDVLIQLIASRTRAVMVVDNCGPELHRQLTAAAQAPESTVSLLTIEYDIRDDQPENTQVIYMKGASKPLILTLVRQRFPEISWNNANRIAEISDGNARMALALAGTIRSNEDIIGIRDQDLFGRLFFQRDKNENLDLMKVAEAGSLLYSFAKNDTTDQASELAILAELASMPVQNVYRCVTDLEDRGLAQARGQWRAVLPHALANRLAMTALRNISRDRVMTILVDQASDRLRLSFSKRLSYLAGPEAMAITREVVSKGYFSSLPNLTSLQWKILRNIAPLIQHEVIAMLEGDFEFTPADDRFSDARTNRKTLIGLLVSLAYDSDLFSRAVELLVKLAEADPNDNWGGKATEALKPLFRLYYSGTCATLDQRLAVVHDLLSSGVDHRERVGLMLVEELLEARHFTTEADFDFGARVRTYGYWPKTADEVHQWYQTVLLFVGPLGTPKYKHNAIVRRGFESQFRGLWCDTSLERNIVDLVIQWSRAQFWPGVWIAVRETLHYDASGLSPESRSSLRELENVLRPQTVLQQVEGITYTHDRGLVDVTLNGETHERNCETIFKRRADYGYAIGEMLAENDEAFQQALPQLLARDRHNTFDIGRGLASFGGQLRWDALVALYSTMTSEERGSAVLRGFIHGLSAVNPGLVHHILDDAVGHPHLGVIFPWLQCAVVLDDEAIGRLYRAVEIGIAPVEEFEVLAGGRACDDVPGIELSSLLEAILGRPKGFQVALDVLHMRLFADEGRPKECDPAVLAFGRRLLNAWDVHNPCHHGDHRFALVIERSLAGAEHAAAAAVICNRIKEAGIAHKLGNTELKKTLIALFKVQPRAALDTFFGRTQDRYLLSTFDRRLRCALTAVPLEEIISWCQLDPDGRFVLMAAMGPVFHHAEGHPPVWRGFAFELLKYAPKPADLIEGFTSQFRPSGWSGSLAAIIEARTNLLTELPVMCSELAGAIDSERERLLKEVRRERNREENRAREAGSFE